MLCVAVLGIACAIRRNIQTKTAFCHCCWSLLLLLLVFGAMAVLVCIGAVAFMICVGAAAVMICVAVAVFVVRAVVAIVVFVVCIVLHQLRRSTNTARGRHWYRGLHFTG